MASNDIGDWYRGIPQITKYWFTGSVIVPLIGRIGILAPQFFMLDFASIFYRFQVSQKEKSMLAKSVKLQMY